MRAGYVLVCVTYYVRCVSRVLCVVCDDDDGDDDHDDSDDDNDDSNVDDGMMSRARAYFST